MKLQTLNTDIRQLGRSSSHAERGESHIKVTICIILGVFAIYAFAITWPVSLALVVAFLTWLLTRNRKSAKAKCLHEAVSPVLVGITLFWVVALLVKWGEPDSTPFTSSRLFEAEQALLQARLAVHAFTGPSLTVFLLVIGVLLFLLYFYPQSQAIGKFLRAKKQLTRLHLCLLAMTSFTFFGGEAADKLAQVEHESRLRDFEIRLRDELDPAKNFLANKLANDTATEVLKQPIPSSTQTRMVYLIESFQQPAYTSIEEGAQSVRVPIDSSSVMKKFINNFSTDVLAQQDTQSSESTLEFVARQQFGLVAESPEDWNRQEELIEDTKLRAEQSEQLYKEASTGITEALMKTFSDALGVLAPNVNELANEWIKELIEEAIVPSFEHEIEGHTDALLAWSRDNLAAGHVLDVPEQLKQKMRPAPQNVSELLFPKFLGTGSNENLTDTVKIPDELITEIRTREERAESEINQEHESQVGEETSGRTQQMEHETTIRREERERLRDREFREGPRVPREGPRAPREGPRVP